MFELRGSLLISQYQEVFFVNGKSDEEAKKRALKVIEQWIKEEECRIQISDNNEQEVPHET